MVEELLIMLLLVLISTAKYTRGEGDSDADFCPLDLENLGNGSAEPGPDLTQLMLLVPKKMFPTIIPLSCSFLNSTYWDWQISIYYHRYSSETVLQRLERFMKQNNSKEEADTCRAGTSPIPIHTIESPDSPLDRRGEPWPDCRLQMRCHALAWQKYFLILSATPEEDITETLPAWKKTQFDILQPNWSIRRTATACISLKRRSLIEALDNAIYRRKTHTISETWRTVDVKWAHYTRNISLSLVFIINVFAILRLCFLFVAGGASTESRRNNPLSRDPPPAYEEPSQFQLPRDGQGQQTLENQPDDFERILGSYHRTQLQPSSRYRTVSYSPTHLVQGREDEVEILTGFHTPRIQDDTASLPGYDTALLPTYEQALEIEEEQLKVHDTKC